MSVRLDGQWLLPATSPHANRLLPLGHGLSRREASIVPALPGLLAAGRAATFPKEARRANGRGNSVTAGRRHECPRTGIPWVSRHSRCPQVPPGAPGPGRRCPRQERPGPSAALAPGRAVRGCEPRAGFAPPSARRVPLRSQVPGRCLRRRAGGRTDGRTDGRAASLLALRSSGRLAQLR